ncbi:hypothetical protein N9U02_00240 [bacterium]|jgi:hypothetical protein|nr:hypothetical protein [Candidatus Actinomarina sp.]MDA9681463.1 hypothetical protein [bacterium]|tara:strand:+ start:17332 stop:17487 length:156 start_codon:yes stop_codon:yes gene_type:complete
MTDYRESYRKLKNDIDKDNSKLITFLFFGILIGRVFEKYRKLKKTIFKRSS